MSKEHKSNPPVTEEEAFEIIELASDDLDQLTRAFNVITEVCENINRPQISFCGTVPKNLIN